MKQVRIGVFETNSSSTHSMVICTKEEFEKWQTGELLYSQDDAKLIKKEDVSEEFLEEFQNYEDWTEDLEEDTAEYTTTCGDKIVVVCKYGHDG